MYDGDLVRLTPETAQAIQRKLGSDIAMCLDQVPSADVTKRDLEDAVRRTTLWARRQREADRAPGQLLFGIAQGHTDDELRRRSIAELVEIGFDGYALGGLAIGEERGQMLETTAWAAPLLPADRPRYFMGLGTDAELLAMVALGVDMFDSVVPTRLARNGTALTPSGHLSLRNARNAARAHGDRADTGRPPQPEERAFHSRRAPARRGLHVSRL